MTSEEAWRRTREIVSANITPAIEREMAIAIQCAFDEGRKMGLLEARSAVIQAAGKIVGEAEAELEKWGKGAYPQEQAYWGSRLKAVREILEAANKINTEGK